jgi:CheY-specific phosphatase CheX
LLRLEIEFARSLYSECAYRLILLLKGSCDSTIDIIDETLPMNQQTFKVKSLGTTCLLSEVAVNVNLVGYCNFKGMLAYRLDKETALVLISSVTINGDASIDATVEHMHKVSKDETASLMLSMNAEWKSLLVADSLDQTTPQKAYPVADSSYWSGQRAAKMRRLQSEPKSPVHP